jgi:hypothetical protein
LNLLLYAKRVQIEGVCVGWYLCLRALNDRIFWLSHERSARFCNAIDVSRSALIDAIWAARMQTHSLSHSAINTRWVCKKSGINHQHTATRRRRNKNANCHQQIEEKVKRNKKEPQRHKFSLRIINLPAEVQLAAIGNFLRRTLFFYCSSAARLIRNDLFRRQHRGPNYKSRAFLILSVLNLKVSVNSFSPKETLWLL